VVDQIAQSAEIAQRRNQVPGAPGREAKTLQVPAGRLVTVEPPGRARETAVQSVGDLLKHAPLLVPIDSAHHRSQGSLVHAPAVLKKKDLFLNVRSQIEQPAPR
jgi:hypothetical protein